MVGLGTGGGGLESEVYGIHCILNKETIKPSTAV